MVYVSKSLTDIPNHSAYSNTIVKISAIYNTGRTPFYWCPNS